MPQNNLIDALTQLNVWKRGDQRAPHKPLLLLYALGQYYSGRSRLIPFTDLEQPLRELLQEFGPYRKSHHPEMPFWYLQSDGVWELNNVENLRIRQGSSNPTITSLRENQTKGGLPVALFEELTQNKQLLHSSAKAILEANFPSSLHSEILNMVGLPVELELQTTKRKKRDPKFRDEILKVYSYRCAICEFDLRIGQRSIGLDAAHIKWHQAGGPDSPNNGLALCTMHHRLFDRGAFTIIDNHLFVSDLVNGYAGLQKWLLDYHAKPLALPSSKVDHPAELFTQWHETEVFKGNVRG